MEPELRKSSKMLTHLDMVMEAWRRLKDKYNSIVKEFRLVYMEIHPSPNDIYGLSNTHLTPRLTQNKVII